MAGGGGGVPFAHPPLYATDPDPVWLPRVLHDKIKQFDLCFIERNSYIMSINIFFVFTLFIIIKKLAVLFKQQKKVARPLIIIRQ